MRSGRQISSTERVALPLEESQNRLRCRTASGDLFAPLDLLMTRSFLVVVAAIRLPGLSHSSASGEVHSMVASRSVIKAISPARPVPSRGPRVFIAGPSWRRSRGGPPNRRAVIATRSRGPTFSRTTAGASVMMTRMRRFSTTIPRSSDGISVRHECRLLLDAAGLAAVFAAYPPGRMPPSAAARILHRGPSRRIQTCLQCH